MRAPKVLRSVTDGDRNTHRLDAPDIGVLGHVRTLNLVAKIVHDLGDAAHADAADPDEVDRANIKGDACLDRPHAALASCSAISASRDTASRRASACALAARFARSSGLEKASLI